MTKGTYTVDDSSSSMDDACNEHGSCNASAMECSDNSDSESEIFRVKRRSTSFDKPTSETKASTLSEQQVCYVMIMYWQRGNHFISISFRRHFFFTLPCRVAVFQCSL